MSNITKWACSNDHTGLTSAFCPDCGEQRPWWTPSVLSDEDRWIGIALVRAWYHNPTWLPEDWSGPDDEQDFFNMVAKARRLLIPEADELRSKLATAEQERDALRASVDCTHAGLCRIYEAVTGEPTAGVKLVEVVRAVSARLASPVGTAEAVLREVVEVCDGEANRLAEQEHQWQARYDAAIAAARALLAGRPVEHPADAKSPL